MHLVEPVGFSMLNFCWLHDSATGLGTVYYSLWGGFCFSRGAADRISDRPAPLAPGPMACSCVNRPLKSTHTSWLVSSHWDHLYNFRYRKLGEFTVGEVGEEKMVECLVRYARNLPKFPIWVHQEQRARIIVHCWLQVNMVSHSVFTQTCGQWV